MQNILLPVALPHGHPRIFASMFAASTLVLPCDSISSPSPSPTNPCLAIRRTRRVDPQSQSQSQSQSRVPAMSPSRFVAVLYVFSCASREQLHLGLGIVRARLVCFWIALTRCSRYSLSFITPCCVLSCSSPLIIITCYSVTLTLNEPRRGPGIRPWQGLKPSKPTRDPTPSWCLPVSPSPCPSPSLSQVPTN